MTSVRTVTIDAPLAAPSPAVASGVSAAAGDASAVGACGRSAADGAAISPPCPPAVGTSDVRATGTGVA